MNIILDIVEVMRVERKIPIVDFVEGICTRRQYNRYKSGEQEVSNINLAAMLDRLEVNFSRFFRKLEEQQNNTKRKLMNQMSLINSYRYREVLDFLDLLDEESLDSESDIKLTVILRAIAEYNLKLITKEHCKQILIKEIDYPNCLEKKYLTFNEQNALIYIMQASDDNEIAERTYKKLLDVNDETDYPWYDTMVMRTNLAREFGKKKMYNELNEIYDTTVAEMTNDVWFRALVNLSYFKLLTSINLKQDYTEDYNNFRTFLYLEGDEKRIELFKANLLKSHNIELN